MSAPISRRIPPQWIINTINPVVRAMARSRLHPMMDGTVLVLHVVGRRTGRHYDIPVGYLAVDGHLVVVTQHAWRANLRGGATVEVTHAGRREPMHAELDEEVGAVVGTLRDVIGRIGWQEAGRTLGLATDDGRPPTAAELAQAVRDYRLAVITLTAPFRRSEDTIPV